MALCGSSRCGCALTVGTGLGLTGSGSAADPWVVRLPRQDGRTEITTGTNGLFTVTFPTAFTDNNYSVTATVESTAVATAWIVTVNSRAAGSVGLRLLSQAGNAGSGVTLPIHWQAVKLP